MSNGFGSGGGGSSSPMQLGWDREPTDEAPVARIAYVVPIDGAKSSAPTTPARQAASITVSTMSPLFGHAANATANITSIVPVSAVDPESRPSDVTCTANACTSTRAGEYNVQVETAFGTARYQNPLQLHFTWLDQTVNFVGATISAQQPTALAATANSGLPVTFSVSSGPCTLVGNTLTATTAGSCDVTASQAGGNPYRAAPSVTRTFTATPVSLVASTDPAALTATAGIAYAYPVTLLDAQGAAVSPQPVIDYAFAPGCTFSGSNVATKVGSCQVTATVRGATSLTTMFTVEVVAGALAQLELTPSAPSVQQGGSLTFTVVGEDAVGNPVDTSGVTLTSSVTTDQISGLTVSFPHASPHVISAKLGSVTASVTVEVAAAPAPGAPSKAQPERADGTAPAAGLASTGQPAGSGGMVSTVALAFIVLGVAFIRARKKTREVGC
ncbi:MAG TPA: hypothetical protein PKV54_00665 [Microbacteriaceae bacterium]|nr:hypothetical protein [Microbacteriaceae bacterium]